MTNETGQKKTTSLLVVLKINSVVSMKAIDLSISHDSSLGVCFASHRIGVKVKVVLHALFSPVPR